MALLAGVCVVTPKPVLYHAVFEALDICDLSGHLRVPWETEDVWGNPAVCTKSNVAVRGWSVSPDPNKAPMRRGSIAFFRS